MSRLLTRAGFEVREAANGLAALEQWESWRPQLVFMDLRMPLLDGRESTRRIRERKQGGHTVIVALTASALDHELGELLAGGADDVLTKPFGVDELFGVIERQLRVEYLYEGDEPARPTADVLPELLPGIDVRAGLRRAGNDVDGLTADVTRLEPREGSAVPAEGRTPPAHVEGHGGDPRTARGGGGRDGRRGRAAAGSGAPRRGSAPARGRGPARRMGAVPAEAGPPHPPRSPWTRRARERPCRWRTGSPSSWPAAAWPRPMA